MTCPWSLIDLTCYFLPVPIQYNPPREAEGMTVWVCGWLDGYKSCHPHPLTENRSTGSYRKAHTWHTQKAHSQKARSLWTLSEAWLDAVWLKSLPGVHNQPWTQEEGWEGETSKVNTGLMWASSIHLPLVCGGEMKQDAKQEDTAAAIDLHACINLHLNLTESNL